MSKYPNFLYSSKDKRNLEVVLHNAFDNCCTPIAITINALGIVKLIDLIFDDEINHCDDKLPVPEDSALVDEETHSYIVNFLNDQIIRLERKAVCEESKYLKKIFLEWISKLKHIYKELVNKKHFH